MWHKIFTLYKSTCDIRCEHPVRVSPIPVQVRVTSRKTSGRSQHVAVGVRKRNELNSYQPGVSLMLLHLPCLC